MAPLGFAVLSLLIGSVVTVEGKFGSRGGLITRAIQSDATCSPDFNWASNSGGETPCLVAAKVLASCAGGNWQINALNASEKYDNPSGTTANLCSCSWAAYNLLSACTACQNVSTSIQNWTPYISGCGNDDRSNTYFPPQIQLTSGTRIPEYATTDPTTWPNQRFDPITAEQIALKRIPDVSQPAEEKKKAPIGAIVGGVVGGVVVVLLAVVAGIFFMRRHGMSRTLPPVSLEQKPGHSRNFSDQSSKSHFIGFGYAPMTHSTPNAPLSPTTLHTHNSSLGSLSQLNSLATMPTPARPFSTTPSIQHASRENVITPFALQPLSPIQEGKRKGSAGVYPVYDSPNARPVNRDGSGVHTPPRTRVNPPTYGESVTGSSPSRPDHRRLNSKSSDSNHSYETNISAPGTWVSGQPAGTGTMSGIGEVMSQVDVDMMSSVGHTQAGNTVASGQSNRVLASGPAATGDRKRRQDNNKP